MQEMEDIMGPDDSAAWTSAVVAIIAAVVALLATGVAVWQAVSARSQSKSAERSAKTAEEALDVARQSAAAAERQAAEARRSNEVAEEQLQLAREELGAQRHRDQREQTRRHVTAVHAVVRAADALRGEINDDAVAVLEYQRRHTGPDEFIDVAPLLFGRAKVEWDEAVNKIRVDKPPVPEVMAAIDRYNGFAKSATQAIEAAHDLAEQHRLTGPQLQALVDEVGKRDDEYEALKQACDAFFAANGTDPTRLASD
ncbi:hypothetical protein L6E12_26985 [Actinokineospora sp. PR83]|uniref:hypothetical protein n=1 Tax=Actinokineospora sp. PR83 TaxID=2884908 RepID=UPI001F1AA497|nr:hypothetical protein [Actinokineospora sp. PR83]MCG8919426.1 hypothetical protein [Actinokineospora sp. PR83]